MEQGISIVKERLKYCPKDILSADGVTCVPLSPDGSIRQFFRLVEKGKSKCLAVLPPQNDDVSMREARSAYHIGRHLFERGINVPEVLWYDKKTGLVVFEDLGDQRVHDKIAAVAGNDQEELIKIYEKIIKHLVKMQFSAMIDFDSSWCYDTEEYDIPVMIVQESEYFAKAFLHDFAGINSSPELKDEFQQIAKCAAAGETKCFLHRDFQSRNIMIKENNYYLIDFQGGRIGPPGYDLASLLNDPYVDLQQEIKNHLFHFYLEQLQSVEVANIEEFTRTYPYLALQRNLQIIGAFSFLYSVRKKPFFKQFIIPSVEQLQNRLEQSYFDSFITLKKLVMMAVNSL